MNCGIGPLAWAAAIPMQFEKGIKPALLALIQVIPYLLPGILPHALDHLPHLVLGGFYDGFNIRPLNRREMQFQVQTVQKLFAQDFWLFELGKTGVF